MNTRTDEQRAWQNIQTWCTMRRAMLAATPQDAEMAQQAADEVNPAWWRGNDAAVAILCQKIHAILDGKDDGRGVANEPWESTRRRLLASQPQQGAVACGFRYRVAPNEECRSRPWTGAGIVAEWNQPTPPDNETIQYQTLYTTIGQQAVDDAAHEALTLLEQATCHDGRYGQMERIGWQESAQKLLPRLRAALATHGKGG